jgi:hypothetical protein
MEKMGVNGMFDTAAGASLRRPLQQQQSASISQ